VAQGLRREIATTQQDIEARDASIARNEQLLEDLTSTMAELLEKYQACEEEINQISQRNQQLTTKTENMTREVRLAFCQPNDDFVCCCRTASVFTMRNRSHHTHVHRPSSVTMLFAAHMRS